MLVVGCHSVEPSRQQNSFKKSGRARNRTWHLQSTHLGDTAPVLSATAGGATVLWPVRHGQRLSLACLSDSQRLPFPPPSCLPGSPCCHDSPRPAPSFMHRATFSGIGLPSAPAHNSSVAQDHGTAVHHRRSKAARYLQKTSQQNAREGRRGAAFFKPG